MAEYSPFPTSSRAGRRSNSFLLFKKRGPMDIRVAPSILVVFFLAVSIGRAQNPGRVPAEEAAVPITVRTALNSPSTIAPMIGEAQSFANLIVPVTVESAGKKSPAIAGALSLVLPGAGEFYTESYWLTCTFLALEGLAWYGNVDYNHKGDVATTRFQGFADQHWSVVKYAQWLNDYAKNFPGGDQAQQIPINPDASLQPWQRVDWKQLNAVELLIPQFSHRLPAHGDQQYYELIGKYDQYSYGWDDKTGAGGDGWSDYRSNSPRYAFYSLERGRANSLYNTATLIANLIIVNHILSAADAAWAALRWNSSLNLHSSVRVLALPNSVVELVPTVQVSWQF
jgi:hypothetical protein